MDQADSQWRVEGISTDARTKDFQHKWGSTWISMGVMMIISCGPGLAGVLSWASPIHDFFLGSYIPKLTVLSGMMTVAATGISALMVVSSSRLRHHTIWAILLLAVVCFSVSGIFLAGLLTEEGADLDASLHSGCQSTMTGARVSQYWAKLREARDSPDCRERSSLLLCDGFEKLYPDFELLWYLEAKYGCSGFCDPVSPPLREQAIAATFPARVARRARQHVRSPVAKVLPARAARGVSHIYNISLALPLFSQQHASGTCDAAARGEASFLVQLAGAALARQAVLLLLLCMGSVGIWAVGEAVTGSGTNSAQ